jgi:uncharacterized membrane protein HdeD (DUF308 family)
MSTNTDTIAGTGPSSIFAKIRKRVLWSGVVMIALGVAALIMPFFISLVVEILIGWLLTISGLVAIIGSFSLRGTRPFIWEVIAGLSALGAGLLMLVFPLQGLVALTVLVAVVMVLTGIAQSAFVLWVRPLASWSWGALSAIISVALGVYILVALPEASTVILGLLVGVDFISTGTALVMLARLAPKATDS